MAPHPWDHGLTNTLFQSLWLRLQEAAKRSRPERRVLQREVLRKQCKAWRAWKWFYLLESQLARAFVEGVVSAAVLAGSGPLFDTPDPLVQDIEANSIRYVSCQRGHLLGDGGRSQTVVHDRSGYVTRGDDFRAIDAEAVANLAADDALAG